MADAKVGEHVLVLVPVADGENVARLDVAVDDVSGVGRGQGAADLQQHVANLSGGKRLAPVEHRLEVFALDKLEGKDKAAAVAEIVFDSDDARVVQLRQQRGFEHQPVKVFAGVDHLQRYRFVGSVDVVGAEHDAERAAAKFRVDYVIPDLVGVGGDGHDHSVVTMSPRVASRTTPATPGSSTSGRAIRSGPPECSTTSSSTTPATTRRSPDASGTVTPRVSGSPFNSVPTLLRSVTKKCSPSR